MGQNRLQGRTVVVTGAAQGQGAAEVEALAAEGATVIATDVLDQTGEALAEALRAEDRPVHYRHLDVTDPSQWASLAVWLTQHHAPLHGLVNNAGIAMRPRLDEVTLTEWDRALAVNTTGPMLGIQALAPLMTAGGSIVNIGSVAGLTAHHAVAYTTSKWALRGLSQVAALELGPRGIRVNTVHPGLIETPLMASASTVFTEAHLALTPLGRPGQCADVAPLIVYLLSDDSAYVHAAEITVDGGFSAHGGTKYILDQLQAAAR